MVDFYEELPRGTGRGEAMRLAQLAVRQNDPHPFYWASFIVTGSTATLDGTTLAPDPKPMQIAPSRRGCGCNVIGMQDSSYGTIAVMLAALGLVRSRRLKNELVFGNHLRRSGHSIR